MSDYGFATYDERTGKKKLGSVNSKWPIFGPKYSEIKKAFRTIHIRDTASYNFRWANLSLPAADITTITEYHGNEKILIATIPHEMGYRPVGYATMTGTFVKNTRTTWKYDKVIYRNVDIGAPDSQPQLYGVETVRGNMLSSAGVPLRALGDGGNFDAFSSNVFGSQIAYPAGQGVYLYLSQYNSSIVIPGNNTSVSDTLGTPRPPYSVEIDDKNIYVYRHYYWCDVWKRSYQYYYESQYINYEWDLRARMEAIIDYAGSEFDLTIYLCPFRMEDLVR